MSSYKINDIQVTRFGHFAITYISREHMPLYAVVKITDTGSQVKAEILHTFYEKSMADRSLYSYLNTGVNYKPTTKVMGA